jgi:hypothetical protein
VARCRLALLDGSWRYFQIEYYYHSRLLWEAAAMADRHVHSAEPLDHPLAWRSSIEPE